MRRIASSIALAAMFAIVVAGSAMAAEPNNPGCLGGDFSSYARYGASGGQVTFAGGNGFGQFNAALAQSVPGLGLPIQFHQAGFISDGYLVNSCNNP